MIITDDKKTNGDNDDNDIGDNDDNYNDDKDDNYNDDEGVLTWCLSIVIITVTKTLKTQIWRYPDVEEFDEDDDKLLGQN